jgi:hypothetical protein
METGGLPSIARKPSFGSCLISFDAVDLTVSSFSWTSM